MKILVTGGAGYIGSVLVPNLLNGGHEVTVLDNFLYDQTSLLDCCFHKNFKIIRGDVRNQNTLQSIMNKNDAIITLAALVGAPLCAQEPYTSKAINEEAIKFIVDNKSNNQLLIYPCTNAGYGIGEPGLYCDEKSPLNPLSDYGIQKVNAESHLLKSKSGISLRLATVFGTSPRMRLDLLVNDFVYRALNDRSVVLFESHFKRNYLHVRDAARVFQHCLDNYEHLKGETYNVGISDANLSKEELCKVIKKFLPNFEYIVSEIGKDPDKRNYIISNKKIEATGFRTKFSLEDGIEELIKGFQIVKRNQFSNI